MINVPKVHKIMNALNQYLRNDSSLPKKVQELAMLVTARGRDCAYIWNAHAASARAAGVTSVLVDAIRDRKPLPLEITNEERAVVRFAQEYFRNHHVSRGAFQEVMEQFGKQGAIELGLLIGNYAALALLVNSFDVELMAQRKEPLLPM